MKTFEFDVTQRVRITIDETIFTTDLMEDFNRSISDFGTDDYAFVQHGEHIAQLAGRGVEDFMPTDFVEGYGVVSDAGIKVEILDDYFFVDRQFPAEGGAA